MPRETLFSWFSHQSPLRRQSAKSLSDDSASCRLRVLTRTTIHIRLVATIVVTILVYGTSSQAAKFVGLSDLAGGSIYSYASGVSANGSVVVGSSDSALGTEAFRWTSSSGMVGLGDLAGGLFLSDPHGISADGLVVIGTGASASGYEAFRWTSGSGMVGLGHLAGGSFFSSTASGVSANGSVVVGSSDSALGTEAFRWTSSGGMTGLGDLAGGSSGSGAWGVSADGSVVVGVSSSGSGNEAFRWTNSGGMTGLGDLVGGTFFSEAQGVSADGSVVVGDSYSTSGLEAFRWTSSGGVVGLGDLAGGVFESVAWDVSANGSVVVGRGNSELGQEAFVWDTNNGMRKVKDVLSPSVGAALNGWTLSEALAVSADGRTVVGRGVDPTGKHQAWLAYLADEVFWFPNTSGNWDSSLSWSGPYLPGAADDIVIDPTSAVTVTGPATHQTVNSLSIGGNGVGFATLRLAGGASGDLNVTMSAYFFPNAELVLADGRSLTVGDVFINYGVIRGSGTVDAYVINEFSGEIRVAAGDSLVISGSEHTNLGKVEVIGGSLEVVGSLNNALGGALITGRNAMLHLQDGMTNSGSLALVGGTNDVFGDINNTGNVVVSGGAAATFYDDITQNGTFRVSKVGSTTSIAVVLGAFTGSGGSTGGGDIFFEGDLRPGNSPAIVTFSNNISFGPEVKLDIELGGTLAGTEYDQVHVTGQLSLAGTLDLVLIDGFTPDVGDSFDILDWNSLSGTFDMLHLPALGGGLTWNTSQLYVTGVLSIGLPGDYNSNGTVDAADYVVWRKNPNAFGGIAGYDTWRDHFGQTAGSGGALPSYAVPETTAPSLLLLTAVCMSCVRSSKRRLVFTLVRA